MDAENLHRRQKIIGQVQAIDRMVDEDIPCEDVSRKSTRRNQHSTGSARLYWKGISSIASATALRMGTLTKPLRALPRQ